eukprot:gene5741-4102_t
MSLFSLRRAPFKGILLALESTRSGLDTFPIDKCSSRKDRKIKTQSNQNQIKSN